ncbi:unnamed protein product, partial [Musa banksii]
GSFQTTFSSSLLSSEERERGRGREREREESISSSMSDSGAVMVYGNGAALTEPKKSSTFSMKVGLAQMLRGGVIMDVVTPGPRCRGGGR